MNFLLFAGLTIVIYANQVGADVVCERDDGTDIKVTIKLLNNNPVKATSIEIDGSSVDEKTVYNNLFHESDGSRDIFSANGLMVSINYMFGCFRDAIIIANARGTNQRFLPPSRIARCTGGSTPDETCLKK